MKKWKNFIFLVLLIIYEELIFSASIFGTISNIGYVILLSIPIASAIFLITTIAKKWNILSTYFFTIITVIIFIAQFIYYNIYQAIISFYSATNAMVQIWQFVDTILEVALGKWYVILLMILPIVILVVLHIFKKLDFEKITLKDRIITLIIALISQIIAILCITLINPNDIYSNKNLYYNVHSPTISANRMGILTTMRLDLQRLIFGFEENTNETLNTDIVLENSNEEEIKPKEIEYNTLDINWDELIENESKSKIKTIYEYMKNAQASNKNEYTGMFEGKNLVVFVAEAFTDLAIDENITPTLYKLYSEGFQFDNFYTPLFPVSTADGEYITDTSLIPKEGTWSLRDVGKNYMPYSYANIFEEKGYNSFAYHDHSATYYDRDKYMKAMGYNSYLARGTGLEKRMNLKSWPSSDIDMIDVTTKDYLTEEKTKFVTYYMTVSGHLNYTTSGNTIVRKNWNIVKDLPYSSKAKGYLSAQLELDRAVELLIKRLEESGELENTVILISGDHYPYGLNLKEINELSDFERDDTFEKHHSIALIWNSTMEEPIKVDKIGSSLDLLPTMLNLFGVEFDSRLLMGTDLLSDNSPLVIYSNRSFITDYGRYSSITKKFEASKELEEGFDENEYVSKISDVIYNKYQVSKLILENNFYDVLWKAMGWK